MKWGLLAVVVGFAALAVWALLGTQAPVDEDAASSADRDVADRGQPALRGLATTVQPALMRNGGTILGVVRRAGVPTAAEVALHRQRAFDPRLPRSFQGATSWVDGLLRGPDLERVASTSAGADGSFAFDVVPAGVYEVVARAPDGASGAARVEVPVAEVRVEASIDLEVGGESLEGRVVYRDGKPFEGIVYAASTRHPPTQEGAGRWSSRTDAQGRFRLTGLPVGPTFLSAVTPGVLAVRGVPVDVPHRGEVLITIDLGDRTISGLVVAVEGGVPVAGASVQMWSGSEKGRMLAWTTTTDADGRFSASAPRGYVRGSVSAPGFVRTNFDVGADPDVVVALARSAQVGGRVLKASDGSPVAGVPVFAAPFVMGTWFPSNSATVSDASGRYTLDGLQPGNAIVFALGAGWQSVGLDDSPRRIGGPTGVTLAPGVSTTFDVSVIKACFAEGKVVDESGAAVAGALVTASQQDETQGSLPQPVANAAMSVVTQADGSFRVSGLLPGRETTLTATAPGRPRVRATPFRATKEGVRGITITTGGGCWVRVRVVATDGTPVREATVTLGMGRGSTGPDGWAMVGPVVPGPGAVSAQAEGYLSLRQSVGVANPCDPRAEVTVTLDRGSFLAGRVIAPAGVPSWPVFVRVHGESDAGDNVDTQPPVDADGRFREGGLAPGTYEVVGHMGWQGESYSGKATAATGSEAVELVMEKQASDQDVVVVRVVDSEGRPVLVGTFCWSVEQKGRLMSRGDWTRFTRGEAELRTTPIDARWVAARGLPGSGLGMAVAGPLPGRTREVEVRLPPERKIRGVVVDAEGRPIRGAWVWAAALGHRDADAGSRTDAEGDFEIGTLGDLDYTVSTGSLPDAPEGASVTAHGGDTGVRIEVRLAREVVLTIRDEDGAPVMGARAWVGGGAVPQQAQSDAEGRLVLRGLREGTAYLMKVNRKSYAEAQLVGWVPRDDVVVLSRLRELKGRVRDFAGNPVVGARVRYRRASAVPQQWNETRADTDGRFRIEELPPEPFVLEAWSAIVGRTGEPRSDPITALPDRGEVTLSLDAGLSIVAQIAPWTPGYTTSAQIASEEPEPAQSGWVTVDPSGRFVANGLEAGRTYTVFVPFLPEGRVVLARGLAPGEVRLVAAPGRTIAGRLTVPQGKPPRGIEVMASQGWIEVGGNVLPDRTFRFEGLPEGRWNVRANGMVDGTEWMGEAACEAGDTVDVPLQSVPPR